MQDRRLEPAGQHMGGAGAGPARSSGPCYLYIYTVRGPFRSPFREALRYPWCMQFTGVLQ